jgi:acetate kinase
MSKHILVLNCGSSSVKFNLFSVTDNQELHALLQGIAEEIGNPDKSRIKYEWQGAKKATTAALHNHREALTQVFGVLEHLGIERSSIVAVGHRVVHGGDQYSSSVRVDDDVLATIRRLIPIAPLHNPPNLTGLEESIRLLPGVPQVAVFDTAFHETMPEYAYRYAIPTSWYKEYGVRKYGFHGTSHMYVARRAARFLGIPFSRFNGITAHLGNGCSLTKILGGSSVDTSMGFTPLEGVIMGTRSGDIDPALIGHVAGKLVSDMGISKEQAYDQVLHDLNKESGLKAIGKTNMMQDIRTLALQGDAQAATVIDIYAYRIAKYIGQYWATLPWADAIVFTAGLGENEAHVRQKILQFLSALAIQVDEEKNAVRKQEVIIGTSLINPDHPLSIMVIPTDEEAVIGYDTLFLGHLNQPVPQVYPFERR